MASKYPKQGYWALTWFEDGKRHTVTLKDSTGRRLLAKSKSDERLAERMRKELEFRLTLPRETVNYNLLFSRAKEMFWESQEFGDSHKAMFRTVFKRMDELLGDFYVKDFGIKEIKLLKNSWSGRSVNTVATYNNYLHQFFRWLYEKKYVSEIPTKRMKNIKKKIRVIPQAVEDKMLDYLYKSNIEHYRIIKMLFLTGFRVMECLDMTWENIDFENKIMYVHNTKGNRLDEFPLYKTLYDFLWEWKGQGRLFNISSIAGVAGFWGKMRDKLKLDYYTRHDIRRTFATKLVRAEIPIFDAMTLLRHTNIQITKEFYVSVELQRLTTNLDKIF